MSIYIIIGALCFTNVNLNNKNEYHCTLTEPALFTSKSECENYRFKNRVTEKCTEHSVELRDYQQEQAKKNIKR